MSKTMATRKTIADLEGTLFAEGGEHRALCDYGRRRYKAFGPDFDSRVSSLEAIPENWAEEVKAVHRGNREKTIAGLAAQFGTLNLERKIEDFIALGSKPMSIIAHHNQMHEQARQAFTIGAYFPALTAACALGERILNHLIIDLRDQFRSTPEYKRVHNKDSFDDWSKAIEILTSWNVLLPEAANEFSKLAALRHRSIHFNQSTYTTLREDALEAIKHIGAIAGSQFSGWGRAPWYMEGTKGHTFVKRDFEDRPFVRTYVLPRCPLVGVNFAMKPSYTSSDIQWKHIDFVDYGDGSLTDDEFAKAYEARSPYSLAKEDDQTAVIA
jgi:hypothetical protein